MRIIQLMPTISFGDGVSNDAAAIDRILREEGYKTGIYAENIDPRLPKGTAERAAELPRLSSDDVILYHGSTGTDLNFMLPYLPGHKVMIYHNITPPDYFHPYSPEAARLTAAGLDGIRFLSDKIEYCLAVSDFNREDLRRMDYRCPIDVLPILIPFSDYEKAPDEAVVRRYAGDGYTNLLFVGRIAPNKRQENVIAAFAEYRERYNPHSRLFLVGSWSGMDPYYGRLCEYAQQLGTADSVIFSGQVRFSEILAYYRVSDVFLSMSEHEGFCIPLVEAMHFELPIVALRSSAIPYTLGGSGILLESSDPRVAAATVDRVCRDETLRRNMIATEHRRLQDYSYQSVRQQFLALLHRFEDTIR